MKYQPIEIGKRYGKLTVIEQSLERKHGEICWICKCDCGNITKPVRSHGLKTGETKSCGCLQIEFIKKRNLVHGFFTNPENDPRIHKVWRNMRGRCFNQKHKDFKDYGGRGITVCDEWKNDVLAFYDYVSKLPHFGEKGYSFDRINNDGNYEPGNVRWATAKEQANNRRKPHKECGQAVFA